MTNHIHLVLETPRANLSQFMQRLQTAYTVWFNRKHQRSGHLFQGRYGASIVAEDEYILKLSRYVHLNPVYIVAHVDKPVRERIGILRSYAWSSYRSYVGLTKRLDFVTYEPVLAMMDKRTKQQASVYRRFVEAGIVDIDAAFIESKRRSRFCIGSEDILEQVAAQHEELAKTYPHREDLCFQQTACHYSVEEVMDAVAEVFAVDCNAFRVRGHGSWLRPLCSRALQVYGGLTQREIAKTLSIGSGAAVSKQLRLLDEALNRDKRLQSWWRDIEKNVVNSGQS
jgi:putative transposase